MRDWEALVEGHLGDLALEPPERAEVIAELAAHLAETCEDLRRQGLTETEAERRVLSKVTNWHDLQRKILIAKRGGHIMKKRVRQLWIPGFLTMTLSTVFLMTLQRLGFNARLVSWRDLDILFYVPWLLSLPIFGALGAYVSSRAGGSRRTALLTSIFPVLALTAAFILMFPIDVMVEPIIGRRIDFSFVATALLRDGIGWILIPGAALLAGGLLAHLLLSLRSSSQDTAIG
jgi:hypothetical protein